MLVRRALALTMLLAAGCSQAAPGVDRELSVTVGDADRKALLVVPEDAPQPVPLVVVLHGLGGSPEQVRELAGLDASSEEMGFAVAYPKARGLIPTWQTVGPLSGGDLLFFAALLEAVDEIVTIDREAVFVLGMSNGGGMAARIGCELPYLVSAVGSVAGAHDPSPCRHSEPVPLMAFHGTADRVVPFKGRGSLFGAVEQWAEAWATANGCGERSQSAAAPDVVLTRWEGCPDPVLLYTVEDGGHGWPGSERAASRRDSTTSIDATALLMDFFFASGP